MVSIKQLLKKKTRPYDIDNSSHERKKDASERKLRINGSVGLVIELQKKEEAVCEREDEG